MPLIRRLPNGDSITLHSRLLIAIVNLGDLEQFEEGTQVTEKLAA